MVDTDSNPAYVHNNIDDDFVPPPVDEDPVCTTMKDPSDRYMDRIDDGIRASFQKYNITIPTEFNTETFREFKHQGKNSNDIVSSRDFAC